MKEEPYAVETENQTLGGVSAGDEHGPRLHAWERVGRNRYAY